MRISEVVQYQHVDDKGPASPEKLAAMNAERAASGQQAADVAAYKAQMASGMYAQPSGAQPATQPAAPATQAATIQPVAPTPPAPPAPPAAPTAPAAPATSAPASWQQIYAANKDVIGANPNLIKPGQQLKMPDGSTYTVKAGDSLSKIAASSKPATAAPSQPAAPAAPASSKIVTPVAPTPAATQAPKRDNFAQANAYLDQQSAAADKKMADTRAARMDAARQKSANANAVVDKELAAMDKGTAAINAQAAAPVSNQYYIQPAKIGMNGEMDYVVVDKNRGVEVKSFNSPAEATAWIKQQPVSESLDRILTIAGLK